MSDFRPREKKPSLLKRDENNQIADPAEAKRVTEELLKKFLTEQRASDKENSFHLARGRKRDVIVHLAVTVLPQVDGHTVIGEREIELEQFCFVLPAKMLPTNNATVIKAFSELCHKGKQELMKLGMVRA